MIKEEQNKCAERWLVIFKDAEIYGNVAEYCRSCGVSRIKFYKKLCSYKKHGVDGLVDRRHLKQSNLKPEVIRTIETTALQNPDMTCANIAKKVNGNLGEKCVNTSSVQRFLKDKGLSSKNQRLWVVEKIYGAYDHPLHEMLFSSKINIESLIGQIIIINPRLRLCKQNGKTPGSIVAYDVAYIGRYHGQKLHLRFVIDTFSSYAIGTLIDKSSSTNCIDYLLDVVVPEFEKREIPIVTMQTDNNPSYNNIKDKIKINHSCIKCTPGKHIGFIDYFKRETRKAFSNKTLNEFKSLQELQAVFKGWIDKYNQSDNIGYPNHGRSPVQMISDYLTMSTSDNDDSNL